MPAIPKLDVGPDFPMATLLADEARAHALFDLALGRVPRITLRMLDAVSRRWLERSNNAQLDEIDAIARRIDRPGTHFLSVNYEWGCTVRVGPSPDGRSARLSRTLDWMTHGLGRFVMAARVVSAAGPFVTLTWPGFTGVLQAMAHRRFSAALNQAPMRPLGGGFYPLDWAVNRARVWRSPYPMPGQLLRTVCETCAIERTEDGAHVIDGVACAGNHWQAPSWAGRARGIDSEGRTACMRAAGAVELDPAFPWLKPPVLNKLTRLVMVADAANGRMVARGYEDCRPVTQPMVWQE